MLFLTGALFMFMSLGCTFVTIARGGYAGVLLFALIFLVLADACLLLAFLKSGRLIRSLSVIVALPTLWVVGDLLRRAPHAWGLG